MKVTDEDKRRQQWLYAGYHVPGSFSPGVKDAHDTEDIMTGPAVYRKIVIAADICEECRFRRSADGRKMKFHLDAADIAQLPGIDKPFGTFTIAFQKIAPAAHCNEVPERIGRRENATVIPADLPPVPVAKCPRNDPDGDIVCTDIFKERMYRYRLHRGHMAADFRSPDTESAHICANVKDPVITPDIIEPVLPY